MTNISHKEILAIAHNSQLDILESELDVLTHHIADVLTYAQRVKDIAATTEITHCNSKNNNVFRCDVVASTVDAESLLQRAPEREGSFFVVPVILEHS